MQLETFIEDDIADFLDRKEDEQHERSTPGMNRAEEIEMYSFDRDYAEEVRNALDDGAVGKARNVFKDLRNEYQNYQDDPTVQRKAHSLMQEIKRMFADYIDENYDEDKTPEDIGITVPAQKKQSFEERREQQIEQLKQQKQQKDKLMDEIDDGLTRVETLLDKGEIIAAIYLYKHLKDSFTQIPKRFKEDRKKAYDEIITCYYQIKKTAGKKPEDIVEAYHEQQDNDQQQRDHTDRDDADTFEKPDLSDLDEAIGDDQATTKEDVLEAMDKLRDQLTKKNARDAYETYQDLRTTFDAYDGDDKHELYKDILSLYENLKSLEDDLTDRKQRAPPRPAMDDTEPSVRERMDQVKKRAYRHLDHDETTSAMKQYNTLKELFQQLDDDTTKEQMHHDLVQLHEDITAAKKNKHFERPKPQACKEELDEIRTLLDNDQLQEAQRKFLQLQSDAIRIKDKDEREDVYDALDTIKEQLHLAHART